MTKTPTINRRGWLAIWLQKRRRARQTKSLPAPSLVSLGTVAGDTTWRAVAPKAVDDWQFCTTDNAFDPEVKSFDQWVDEADAPDTEFVSINSTTANVTVDFAYCAARYRVGATWSSWTGVLDATVIPPPVQLVLSSDGHGHLTWTCNVTINTGFSIFHSVDGVDLECNTTDSIPTCFIETAVEIPGYFRIAIGDDDGNPMLPYSNMVYSDGL